MIINTGLLSLLLETESVAQNCWKGISLRWRTLSGTFSERASQAPLRHKTGVSCSTTLQPLHQHVWHIEWISMTTLTFSGGQRKLFQEDGIHWSPLRAEERCKNLLGGLQIFAFRCVMCPQPNTATQAWICTSMEKEERDAGCTSWVYGWLINYLYYMFKKGRERLNFKPLRYVGWGQESWHLQVCVWFMAAGSKGESHTQCDIKSQSTSTCSIFSKRWRMWSESLWGKQAQWY